MKNKEESPVVYTKHTYDVDIIQNFHELCKLADQDSTLSGKEEYKNTLKELIEYYCEFHYIKIDLINNRHSIVVVPNTEPAYIMYLGQMLIWFPIHKIPLLLDYQKKKHSVKEDFVSVVEHKVIRVVESAKFDKTERLKEIMNWVREQQKEKSWIGEQLTDVNKSAKRRSNKVANQTLFNIWCDCNPS